jgi:hypothetical protein
VLRRRRRGAAQISPSSRTTTRVAHAKATNTTGGFCTNAKLLDLAWRKYLEQPNPLDPETIRARIFYSRRYLGRMLKYAPASRR